MNQQGYPRGDWQSEESVQEPHYSEKQSQHAQAKTSKRYIWRMCRLALSIAMTIAALVLTLIILVVGRHGNAGSDLALITVSLYFQDILDEDIILSSLGLTAN